MKTSPMIVLASFICLLVACVSAFSPAPATTTEFPGVVDEAALLKESTFPIAPDELILRAKDVLCVRGVGTRDGAECLADNFVFRAAVVEINREDYIKALASFSLEDAFDITQQCYNFNVDPFQTNRVWCMIKQKAVHSRGSFQGVEPNGKELVLPPQYFHFDFNTEGKLTEFGFYTVDRAQGNTGGLGGAFGFFYGVGRAPPIPEMQPYQKSWQRRTLEWISKTFSSN